MKDADASLRVRDVGRLNTNGNKIIGLRQVTIVAVQSWSRLRRTTMVRDHHDVSVDGELSACRETSHSRAIPFLLARNFVAVATTCLLMRLKELGIVPVKSVVMRCVADFPLTRNFSDSNDQSLWLIDNANNKMVRLRKEGGACLASVE